MTSTLLFKDIDAPRLNTIDVYQRRGGYQSLRKALQMPPEAVLNELSASGLRGRGGAGFAMGKKASFLPKGSMDKYLCCNADESEPGTFKDRELMQKSPHMLIEGMIIAAYAAGINRAFIYIRGEYALQADILDEAVKEAEAAGFLGKGILGTDLDLSLVVHRGAGAYICGEETALLDSLEGKRGNPRLKPPFPANQGPLPGPHADQQRRDAGDRAAHHRDGRRRVRQDRRGELDGHEARVGLGQRQAPGQLRDRARHEEPGHHLRPGRRPARRPRGQVLVPGGSSSPCCCPRTSSCPTTSTRWPRPARCSARARSSSSTTRTPSSTSRCGRRSSTATSPAASARRAARARTGP
jgi:hypothetical protein